jgi:hypothetical protein
MTQGDHGFGTLQPVGAVKKIRPPLLTTLTGVSPQFLLFA